MPQNLFKIYDGRNYFWQWDTNQKLVVLDDTIDEVHFSNKNMTHAIPKDVVVDKDGQRVCYIPDSLLTLPKNLIATASVTDNNANSTVRTVIFAVKRRQIPSDYIVSDDFQFSDFTERLSLIEAMIADACLVQKFESLAEAEQWAQENKKVGTIISVKVDSQYVAYTVAEDYSVMRVCDCDKETILQHISTLQKLVGNVAVSDQIKNAINDLDLPSTYDQKGAAAQSLSNAKEYTNNLMNEHKVTAKKELDAEIARASKEEQALTTGLHQVNDRITNVEGSIDKKIAEAVAKIMENPDETINSINELVEFVREVSETGGIRPNVSTITMYANKWAGADGLYSQVVEVSGVSENSKIDQLPTAVQIVELHNKNILLMIDNDDGIVTVYAIGNKPTKNYTMKVSITEVTHV